MIKSRENREDLAINEKECQKICLTVWSQRSNTEEKEEEKYL